MFTIKFEGWWSAMSSMAVCLHVAIIASANPLAAMLEDVAAAQIAVSEDSESEISPAKAQRR